MQSSVGPKVLAHQPVFETICAHLPPFARIALGLVTKPLFVQYRLFASSTGLAKPDAPLDLAMDASLAGYPALSECLLQLCAHRTTGLPNAIIDRLRPEKHGTDFFAATLSMCSAARNDSDTPSRVREILIRSGCDSPPDYLQVLLDRMTPDALQRSPFEIVHWAVRVCGTYGRPDLLERAIERAIPLSPAGWAATDSKTTSRWIGEAMDRDCVPALRLLHVRAQIPLLGYQASAYRRRTPTTDAYLRETHAADNVAKWAPAYATHGPESAAVATTLHHARTRVFRDLLWFTCGPSDDAARSPAAIAFLKWLQTNTSTNSVTLWARSACTAAINIDCSSLLGAATELLGGRDTVLEWLAPQMHVVGNRCSSFLLNHPPPFDRPTPHRRPRVLFIDDPDLTSKDSCEKPPPSKKPNTSDTP